MYRVYVEGSGSVGAAGVVFVEGGQGLIPAASATRPTAGQSWANQVGGTSMKTYLRKG